MKTTENSTSVGLLLYGDCKQRYYEEAAKKFSNGTSVQQHQSESNEEDAEEIEEEFDNDEETAIEQVELIER